MVLYYNIHIYIYQVLVAKYGMVLPLGKSIY
jgi:hypothetical protein